MLRRIRHDDRGAGLLSGFLVLFSVLLLAGVGILVDSARIMSASRESTSIAMEAARAGANALEAELLRDGSLTVNPGQASAVASDAAASFVARSGASLQSVSVSGNSVTVTVSASVNSWFPLMSSRMLTKTATATANREG